MTTLENCEITDVVKFAKAWVGVGWSVQEQVDDLLNMSSKSNYHQINPAAIDVMKDKLGGMHPELDYAIEQWEEVYYYEGP
jgi:hypothetical protein